MEIHNYPGVIPDILAAIDAGASKIEISHAEMQAIQKCADLRRTSYHFYGENDSLIMKNIRSVRGMFISFRLNGVLVFCMPKLYDLVGDAPSTVVTPNGVAVGNSDITVTLNPTSDDEVTSVDAEYILTFDESWFLDVSVLRTLSEAHRVTLYVGDDVYQIIKVTDETLMVGTRVVQVGSSGLLRLEMAEQGDVDIRVDVTEAESGATVLSNTIHVTAIKKTALVDGLVVATSTSTLVLGYNDVNVEDVIHDSAQTIQGLKLAGELGTYLHNGASAPNMLPYADVLCEDGSYAVNGVGVYRDGTLFNLDKTFTSASQGWYGTDDGYLLDPNNVLTQVASSPVWVVGDLCAYVSGTLKASPLGGGAEYDSWLECTLLAAQPYNGTEHALVTLDEGVMLVDLQRKMFTPLDSVKLGLECLFSESDVYVNMNSIYQGLYINYAARHIGE